MYFIVYSALLLKIGAKRAKIFFLSPDFRKCNLKEMQTMSKKNNNRDVVHGNGMKISPFTIIINREKEIVFVNSGFENDCGYLSNTLAGKNVDLLVDDHFDEIFKSVSARIPHKFVESFGEVFFKKENGQTFIANCFVISVYDDYGDLQYGFISGTYSSSDLNSKKYSNNISKTDSTNFNLDQIGHDFNNLLTAISGNAQLALFKLDGEKQEQKYLRNILDGSERLQKLMSNVFE